MAGSQIPTASPASVGVDSRAVDAFLAAIEDAGLELHGFMLSRHGAVCAQGWWEPYAAQRPHLLYSLSKTFTATAWCLAEVEGLVERDRPLVEYWPEHAPLAGPRARRWTARHLLAMASGHTAEVFAAGTPAAEAVVGEGTTDAVAWCFAQEPDAEPGSIFTYNQLCTYLLAATVQRVAGESLTSFLRPRLLDPLGVDVAAWQTDNRGQELGFTGLFARLDAVWRLGQLSLDRGRWGGRHLLPGAWFDDAARAVVTTDHPEPDGTPRNPDWSCGYGYQLWMARHGYRGDGAFGQFMLVLDEADAVLAIHAGTANMQGVLDCAWQHLLPGLTGSGSAPHGEPQQWSLRLRPQGGAGAGGRFVSSAATYDDALGTWPVPVHALTVEPTAESSWRLVLAGPGDEVRLTAGDGRWLPDTLPGREGSVQVAASAGWQEGSFVASIRLLETPHAVELLGRPEAGELVSRWSVPPLRGATMADLGLPGRF